MRYAPHFRKWLVKQLRGTAWVRMVRTREDAEKLAPRLYLHPDALWEARQLHEKQSAEQGLQPALGRKKAGTAHPQIAVYFPKDRWEQWHTWCEEQHVDSSTALRAIIHAYLLGAWEPRWRTHRWVGRDGKPVALRIVAWEEEHKAAWPYREKALLTRGGMTALRRRAERINVKPATLVRGIILAAFAGHPAQVRPIDARAMWDDPDKYPMPK